MSQEYTPPKKLYNDSRLFNKPLRFVRCKHCKETLFQWSDGYKSKWLHSNTREAQCEIVVTYAEPDN